MQKHGILNSEIAKVLADLGHTDQLVIGDAGLPVPTGVKKIDLALKAGEPSFLTVLDILVEEMEIEEVILASEIKTKNLTVLTGIKKHFETPTYVTHEQFKVQTKEAKVIIRTGEVTPYANIILQAGVFF